MTNNVNTQSPSTWELLGESPAMDTVQSSRKLPVQAIPGLLIAPEHREPHGFQCLHGEDQTMTVQTRILKNPRAASVSTLSLADNSKPIEKELTGQVSVVGGSCQVDVFFNLAVQFAVVRLLFRAPPGPRESTSQPHW